MSCPQGSGESPQKGRAGARGRVFVLTGAADGRGKETVTPHSACGRHSGHADTLGSSGGQTPPWMHQHVRAHMHMHSHTQAHTCVHTRTHAYTLTYMSTLTCFHTHVHTDARTYAHTGTHTHMHIHTHVHTLTHVFTQYVHTHLCTHTLTHAHIYTCTHRHTCTSTLMRTLTHTHVCTRVWHEQKLTPDSSGAVAERGRALAAGSLLPAPGVLGDESRVGMATRGGVLCLRMLSPQKQLFAGQTWPGPVGAAADAAGRALGLDSAAPVWPKLRGP